MTNIDQITFVQTDTPKADILLKAPVISLNVTLE